ncbi:hypothetical protein DQ04_08461020 [Trypanosoma grayi]|uniref:hypothetical protein n=1 Tax=Trypanosoma grayi TaxID=71804 RepID=UPI0004F44E34|nr:hypothetical protein DQ04_08461020 [Trypanosoma grayi]KEG07926.1 hypothetical protein DQ04_08461020 [Trypanosoma grayi]
MPTTPERLPQPNNPHRAALLVLHHFKHAVIRAPVLEVVLFITLTAAEAPTQRIHNAKQRVPRRPPVPRHNSIQVDHYHSVQHRVKQKHTHDREHVRLVTGTRGVGHGHSTAQLVAEHDRNTNGESARRQHRSSNLRRTGRIRHHKERDREDEVDQRRQ